jgi:hypothetical protein
MGLILHPSICGEGEDGMPDVSRTEIGRRMFQLQKEKAVEQVIEKIRQNIGSEWKTLSTADVHLLERLLQAAWVNTDKAAWEKLRFNKCSKEDVQRILSVARGIDLEKTSQHAVAEDLEKVLLTIG